MIEYTIKILGAQYAANPDYKFGDPETPEMWARTIGMLSNLRDMKPRVVLKLEPTNPHDHLAVMARAMGNKIGYVCKPQRDKVRTMISQSKRGMLAADISEVVVNEHGYLFVTLKCPEAVDDSTQEPGFDWSEWQTDIPLLPPMDALHAEEEAEFILEEELLPYLADVDITELQTYLGIWIEGSRHDMSHEASRQRELYVKLLEESTRDDVHELARELKHQSGSMCCRHRLEERTQDWWPRLVDSDEAANMWGRWCEQTKGQLWSGLQLIDGLLRRLPGNLYHSIGHMEAVFSQLYYLCIPRAALTTILSLLVLRERTCRELGIEMRPMTEEDYEKCMPESGKFSMKDLASSFLKFPTKFALGMFGGVSTLLAWHPEWQMSAPQIEEQILAKEKEQQDRQEQKQDKMIEEVEKAANKKTNEFNVYPQAGSTANLGCQMQSPEFKVIPPSKEQQPALESRSATKGDACQSKNKEGDENV
jgi:hypothetical protein